MEYLLEQRISRQSFIIHQNTFCIAIMTAIIQNETDLIRVVQEVNERLQSITDYLGMDEHEGARIRFPRGYLRKCAVHREKYAFLNNRTLQSNIAYAKMTTDIFRWLLNRTDISLSAQEMLIKQGISIIGAVAEAVVKTVLIGCPGGGNKQNFKKRLQVLVDTSRIDQTTQVELEWLWDTRNNVHLMLLDEREYKKYSIADYNRAVRGLTGLRISLGGQP